jgi:hypothetical protein
MCHHHQCRRCTIHPRLHPRRRDAASLNGITCLQPRIHPPHLFGWFRASNTDSTIPEYLRVGSTKNHAVQVRTASAADPRERATAPDQVRSDPCCFTASLVRVAWVFWKYAYVYVSCRSGSRVQVCRLGCRRSPPSSIDHAHVGACGAIF